MCWGICCQTYQATAGRRHSPGVVHVDISGNHIPSTAEMRNILIQSYTQTKSTAHRSVLRDDTLPKWIFLFCEV